MKNASIFGALLLLTACGEAPTSTSTGGNAEKAPTPKVARTCESIRPDVVRVAATNGVVIVKIYEPVTLLTEPKKVSCSGRAVVSTGVEAQIYYRSFQDEEGDWMIQYAEQPLEK